MRQSGTHGSFLNDIVPAPDGSTLQSVVTDTSWRQHWTSIASINKHTIRCLSVALFLLTDAGFYFPALITQRSKLCWTGKSVRKLLLTGSVISSFMYGFS